MDPLTKTEFAMSQLRDAITSGKLRPGDWIRADQWADRMGLSETPVREALSRLEGLGLVEIFPHRGARVTTRTREHIVETYVMRSALEGAAARAAIERTSDEQLNELIARVDDLTERMGQAVEDGDVARIREINHEIHWLLYDAAALPRLTALIKGLWAIYPFDTLDGAKDRPAAALKEHITIRDALRSRDARALQQAVEQHLAAAQMLIAEMPLPEEA